MNPYKPMMGGGDRGNGVASAEPAVAPLKMIEEARNGTGTDRDMAANLDITLTQLAGLYPNTLATAGHFDPEQFLGQIFAEARMRLRETFGGVGTASKAAGIDPFLDSDVRPGFELEIPLLRIVAEIVIERALDVYGVGVVSFDEIAVIAVHGPHEMGEGRLYLGGQAAAKSGRLRGKIDGEVTKLGEARRPLTDLHRLHLVDCFAAIFRHDVRFIGRFYINFKSRKYALLLPIIPSIRPI